MKKRILTGVAIIITAVLLASVAFTSSMAANQYGLTEQEVKTVQQRLKSWGYYTGAVDGVYGQKTIVAVQYFQRKHSLTPDGIVGSKTAEKLGIRIGAAKSNAGGASNDVYLLAKVIYGEARGEPYQGKVAVGAVVLNRVENPNFPNSMWGVVYQKGAFSIVADGQINLTPDADALKAARDAINGKDPVGGAIYYYNPKKTSNKFIISRPVITTIGDHVFCS